MTKTNSDEFPGLVKLFYRIGEVSRLVGVAPHVLRYWESEFSTVRPQKSSHGQRIYSRKDVQKLLAIKVLLKEQGFTIEGARKRLREGLPEIVAKSAEEPVSPPVERGSFSPPADSSDLRASGVQAKAMRGALLGIRKELMSWLDELNAPTSQSA
jgi:DNA-binding transcriptional MerR regulator